LIYPTGRAVLFIALGAPIATVLAAVFPSLWAIGLAWSVMLFLLLICDGLIAAKIKDVQLAVPKSAEIGTSLNLRVNADFVGLMPPRGVDVNIGVDRDRKSVV